MLELSTLRVFLAAAEEKNFSQAARRLHLSQSAVSQNIQTLEHAYGIDLFLRRGRSVALSEAGEAILPMVRGVLRSARLLEDTLQNINAVDVGGELLIGCSTSAGKYLMPALLSMFQLEYPAVHPRVKIMSRDGIFERLLQQVIPMGASSKLFEHREIDCQPLFEDRIILIVDGQVARIGTPAELMAAAGADNLTDAYVALVGDRLPEPPAGPQGSVALD